MKPSPWPSPISGMTLLLRDRPEDMIEFTAAVLRNPTEHKIKLEQSTMPNTADLADNAAELLLVDPRTRSLLEPTGIPESGNIKPLAVTPSAQCSRSMPVQ